MEEKAVQKKGVLTRQRKRLIFYTCLIAIPSLQFLLFYFYVNFNSILLSFQKYEIKLDGIGYNVSFAFFENFSKAWGIFTSSGQMILNSLTLYLCNLVIVSTFALLFSYYIAKKHYFSGFFRVMLFLPNIISQVALVTIFKTVVNNVFVEVMKSLGAEAWLKSNHLEFGLLSNSAPDNVIFGTVLVYNLWVGFGTNVMMYTGAMSAIDQSIIESAQLDGVSFLGEFIHIYVPLIWPTFTTFVVTGLTGLFTSTMHLVVFYGTVLDPPFEVFGYFLYKQTLNSSLTSTHPNYFPYSILSSLGVIVTIILVPVTLTVRKLMEKYGPRTD